MSQLISDFSLWVVFVWVLISLGIVYWFYLPKAWLQSISKPLRYVMAGLRFLGLVVLGVLFVGLILQDKSYTKEKPLLLTMIDNSSSMLNYSDSLSVKENVSALNQALETNFSNDFTIITYDFNGAIKNNEELDNITFTHKKSPIAQFFHTLYDTYYGRNIGSVIVVSDGNYNAGAQPITVADRLKMTPIYTLGVGDMIQKKDQLIASVNHNDIAFLGNKFPVEVVVEGNLMQGEKTKLNLSHNGKVLASETITYTAETETQKVLFYLEAKDVGFVSYQLELEGVPDESNYENNSKTIYVEVLDARSKILLVGGAPHPDLGAIKQVLALDNNLEVNAFLLKDLPENLAVYDLIICHEPGINNLTQEMDRLRDAKVPIWYIFGSQTKGNQVSKLGLPITYNTSGKTDEVNGAINQLFTKFELSESTKEASRKFPPLTIPYGQLQINQSMDVVFYQQVGPVIKKDPLYFLTQQQDRKVAITLGEGLWRWKLTEFQRNKNNSGFNEIVQKTVQYLAVKANTSRLRVQLPKTFNEDESVVFTASFYNESFDPVTNVPITLTIKNEAGEETYYDFVPGERNYTLDIGILPSGSYSWSVLAKDKAEEFVKEGAFVVKKIELEALDTRANHNLLNRIASNSGASFALLNDYEQVIAEIKARDDVAPVSYESILFKKLIDYKWLFFLFLFLVSLEWFLRRYLGGY